MADEPLTPADCDLRGLPFMPLDVVRLLDSDFFALSTPAEFKAGVSLWCKSWLQVPAASLPDDDRILAHLSGAGGAWKKMKSGAMRGWRLCSDGRWYHPTVAEKANEAWRHRLSQRAKIAKRWNRGTDDDGSAGNSTEDTTVSTAVIQGTGRGRVKGKEEEPDGSSPPKSPAPKPAGFALPEWVPEAEWLGFCEMRRRIKAPLTDRAKGGIIRELAKLAEEGHPPGRVLDQSTTNAWRGVFPLKDGTDERRQGNRGSGRPASGAGGFARLVAASMGS